MTMLNDPSRKYRACPRAPLAGRTWPDAEITASPTWCSVDLRDGNQALVEPMDGELKRRMFDTLVAIGFREIEIGFPSASQTEFDFVRSLIDEDAIPDHVTVQVLTQAREDLIRRTFEALRGASRAIFHFYHATSPVMRRVVFQMDEDQVIEQMAVRHARLIKDLAEAQPDTDWTLQYSPEMFTDTELEFSKRVVDAVTETWAPTPDNKCIINLTSTMDAEDIWEIVEKTYLADGGRRLVCHQVSSAGNEVAIEVCLDVNGERMQIQGYGPDLVHAMLDALHPDDAHVPVVSDVSAHAIAQGRHACYVELRHDGGTRFGVGIDDCEETASIYSVLSGLRDEAEEATGASRAA